MALLLSTKRRIKAPVLGATPSLLRWTNRSDVRIKNILAKEGLDKDPLISYIYRMKGKIKMKNNFEKRYAKGIKLDVRTKSSCYVTMKTNAGPLTVYIDSMDNLTDPPMVHAWIKGRKDKEMFIT